MVGIVVPYSFKLLLGNRKCAGEHSFGYYRRRWRPWGSTCRSRWVMRTAQRENEKKIYGSPGISTDWNGIR